MSLRTPLWPAIPLECCAPSATQQEVLMSSDSLAMVSEVPAAGAESVAPARKTSATVRVGVIGYGYWGPNIVRNLHGLEHCQVVAVCDKNPSALKRAQKTYPGVQLTTNFSEVLESPDT